MARQAATRQLVGDEVYHSTSQPHPPSYCLPRRGCSVLLSRFEVVGGIANENLSLPSTVARTNGFMSMPHRLVSGDSVK
jgi:hypothetical protein